MEEQEEARNSENEKEADTQRRKQGVEAELEEEELQEHQNQERGDKCVLRFLDSMDSYLTLMDSLSSTLRQGWLELASARHSMGSLRISGALLDLKCHSAATTLQVTEHNVDSVDTEPQFTLCKWASSDTGKCGFVESKSEEDKLHTMELRHRGNSQLSEEKASPKDGALLAVDNEVEKVRSKSLSVFGALVSPKLRAAQLSFEAALETLIAIANVRSSMLSSHDQVCRELEVAQG